MRQERAISVADAFAEAMRAYERGKLASARRLGESLTASHPGFGGAHYLLGLIALAQDRPRRATEHLAQAIAITPNQAAPHFAMGQALEILDNPQTALHHYRRVLTLDPGHADAHARLGKILRRLGRRDEAIDHFHRAIERNASHAEALGELGALLLEQGKTGEAARHLRAALQLRPSWAAALNNFGLALLRLGHLDQAEAILSGAIDLKPERGAYRAHLAAVLRAANRLDEARAQAEQATQIEPGCAKAWLELGLIRQSLGHDDAAAAAFERAMAVDPDLIDAHWCQAELCRRRGWMDRASHHYQTCLALDPADHHGAALGLALAKGAPAPAKPPIAYVRQLFDDYADRFDQSLVQRLTYRGPERLEAAIVATLAQDEQDRSLPTPRLDVLDAGCGTGLMGAALRPLARTLDGIDLSRAMLDKAAARGIYDDLTEGDLLAILRTRLNRYDMIVAADVLIYFGGLDPIMGAVHDACRPGGLFAFTTERTEAASGYALGLQFRYQHSPAYLRDCARMANFSILRLDDVPIRRENGVDVPGLIAVLRRPA